jgi:predicted O-methyltransferase YrrM
MNVKQKRTNDLHLFCDKLANKENFSVVKFNDGEWHAMTNKSGSNCDNHFYSERLSVDLLTAYKYLNNRDDVFISDYVNNFCAYPQHEVLASDIGFPKNSFVNFALLHDLPFRGEIQSLTPELKEFYRLIRDDTREKIFIGPDRLSGVIPFLNIDHFIPVPLLNAYDTLHLWWLNVPRKENAIYLLSCGFNSCIVSSDLLQEVNATIIDLGSALDPVVFGKTRKSQMDTSEIRQFYQDWNIEWAPMAHYYQHLPGWFNFPDLYLEMVQRFDSGHFVEVGTWMGKSAAYMGIEIMRSGKKIKFDCVDHFKGSKEELDKNHKEAQYKNVRGLCANNLRPFWSTKKNSDPFRRIDNILKIIDKPSLTASNLYEKRSLDFVFIDAGHSYEEVKKDIQAWLPKVKKGGVLAGHDYSKSFPGVVKAVRESLPGHVQKSKNCWFYEV